MRLGTTVCCGLLLALFLVTSAFAARFTDNGDQTVTDTLTGLTWTKNANLPGASVDYQQAVDFVAGMNSAHSLGRQDWRVPTIEELFSLVDLSHQFPSLPAGNPFTGVVQSYYWSSTPIDACINGCLSPEDKEVEFGYGNLSSNHLWNNDMLWPVRGVMNQSGPVAPLPAGTTGASYSQTLSTSVGLAPYTWSLTSGSLPSGLTLNSGTGVISGTTGKAGVFSFTVQFTDSLGFQEARSLAITVTALACAFPPVRIAGAVPVFYQDFPDAYALAADQDVIQLEALDFTGDLLLNRDLRVSLQGGYNCGFSSGSGTAGVLGALRVRSGTVKVSSLLFK